MNLFLIKERLIETSKLCQTLGRKTEHSFLINLVMSQTEDDDKNQKLTMFNAHMKPYYHNHCSPVQKQYMVSY